MRRRNLNSELTNDKNQILPTAVKLIQAMTDCISSNGWLKPTLMAMKLSQMIVQGMWIRDSPLTQLPHFDKNLLERCKKAEITSIGKNQSQNNRTLLSIDDIMDMEDEDRLKLLQLDQEELGRVAFACGRYPDIEFEATFDATEMTEDDREWVKVSLNRFNLEENEKLEAVYTEHYPVEKDVEYWWIVAGDAKKNQVLGIKRVSFEKQLEVKVPITGLEPDDYEMTVYLICDSYVGCDQEVRICYFFILIVVFRVISSS